MTYVLIAIIILIVLAGLMLFASARRREGDRATGYLSGETRKRDRSSRGATPLVEPVTTGRDVEKAAQLARRGGDIVPVAPAPVSSFVPPDPDEIGVARRQFLNRSIIVGMLVSMGGFGASLLAFLWPPPSGGFGSKISVGKITDIKAAISQGSGFAYYPQGRMWITAYPSSALDKAKAIYPPSVLTGMEAGVVALYQRCVHLGCRVPACITSQWFECPCHGSQYSQVGEKKGGPAPRGLDRFPMTVAGGVLGVDTGTILLGPPIGTNTTDQEAEGPHCVSGGGG